MVIILYRTYYSVLDDFKDDEGHKAIIKLTNDNLSEHLPSSPYKINMTAAIILSVVNLQNISNDKFKRQSFKEYVRMAPQSSYTT
jgi:hypothetical protein